MKTCSFQEVTAAQEVERGHKFSPKLLLSLCQSVLEQDTEPQVVSGGSGELIAWRSLLFGLGVFTGE